MVCKRKIRLKPEQIAAISRAVADPRRYAMLQQIAASGVTPCSKLEAHGGLCAATISHHLKELVDAELIRSEREGRGMNLTLRRDVWEAYMDALARL